MPQLSSNTARIGGQSEVRELLRLAAIDVGSNSIHMIVAQADADGAVTTLWRLKEPVGLGRMSFPSKKLTTEAMDRAVEVLARFRQAARQRQAEKIIAVATSAIREAENGGDLIERIRRELGMHVRVVGAREEARLIYLAVRQAIALHDKPHLMIDIGGGSVEFVVGDESRTQLLESRKLGAARMTAQFVKSDPIDESDLAKLRKHYDKELALLCENIRAARPVRVIGTSGTLENLAAMCGSEQIQNGDGMTRAIERKKFEKMLANLLESKSKDRSRMTGLDEQRRDQITAGAVLVGELFSRLDIKRIEICPMALREGILLDYLARHQPDLAVLREVPDPRRRSVIDLARRCDWHKAHSEQVTAICLKLFDELRQLHGLGSAERELIEYASLLHDIGWHIGRNGHHKHSMYLILHGDLKHFSPEETRIIGNITRYHRKSIPKLKHMNYVTLAPKPRRIVDVGAALLRIADGLDRSHCSVIQDLRCKVDGKQVKCTLTVRSDAELEIWGARRKMDLFEKVFGRKLSFDLHKK